MLVNHTDTQINGIVGTADVYPTPLEEDFPLLSLFDAEDHLHQRGLARSVLPDDGVDAVSLDGNTHTSVGSHSVFVDLEDVLGFQDFFHDTKPLPSGTARPVQPDIVRKKMKGGNFGLWHEVSSKVDLLTDGRIDGDLAVNDLVFQLLDLIAELFGNEISEVFIFGNTDTTFGNPEHLGFADG